MENPHLRDTKNYTIKTEKQTGYRYLSPMPTESEIDAMYSDDYYQKHYLALL